MMKTNKILIVLIPSLLLTSFFNVKLVSHKKRLETYAQELEKVNNTITSTNQRWVYLESYGPETQEFEIKFDSYKILNGIGKEDSQILKETLTDQALVLRFKKDHCNSCIQQELSTLKRFRKIKEYANVPIIVFGEFHSPKDFIIAKKSLAKSNIPLIELTSELDYIIEKSPVPYSFVWNLNKNRVSSTFMVEASLPQRSEDYYSSIFNYLNTNNYEN